MEDEHPSLPSNYVSLVQLQERWLKEQQPKQREKEERKREEDQQQQRPKENGDKGLDNSVSVSRRPVWRNRRNRGARDRKTVEESNPNLEVSKIKAVVSQDEPKKDELKELKERVKKKKNKRRKPSVEENLAGVTSQMAPVEKLQVFVTERNGESEPIESKFWRNGGDQGVNHKVLEPKVQIDQAATLARNVEELSLNDKKECMRLAGKSNAGRPQYRGSEGRGSERADRRKLSKQRDCNPVEKLQVFVTKRNGESEQIESKFRRNGGDQGINHKVLESKVQIDQAATLARNVEELSLNDRKDCMRSAGKTNAGRRQYRGSERADRRKLTEQRECNLVWVKKGEITGTEIQSSGTSVKAGMDKKQQRPGHSKHPTRD